VGAKHSMSASRSADHAEDENVPSSPTRVWSRHCRSRYPPGRSGSQIACPMKLDGTWSFVQAGVWSVDRLVVETLARTARHSPRVTSSA
jgi:hypothetical protein